MNTLIDIGKFVYFGWQPYVTERSFCVPLRRLCNCERLSKKYEPEPLNIFKIGIKVATSSAALALMKTIALKSLSIGPVSTTCLKVALFAEAAVSTLVVLVFTKLIIDVRREHNEGFLHC